MAKNTRNENQRQLELSSKQIQWRTLIKEGIITTLGWLIVVTIVFGIFLGTLFVVLSFDNPVGSFIDKNDTLSAFIFLLNMIAASLWLATVLSKKLASAKKK